MPDSQNGLKLELSPTRAAGLPAFRATIKNVASEPIIFCSFLARHRLMSRMNADGYEVFVFEPTPREPVSEEDLVTLSLGQSLSYDLDFGKDGYEWLWAGSQPSTVSQDSAMKEFPSGAYTFVAHIGDHITFSTAPSGQSGAKERLNIFTDLEGVALPQQCWKGDLVAECKVEFG